MRIEELRELVKDRIFMLLKFGEDMYMNYLHEKGEICMRPVRYYRELERKSNIRGQGDMYDSILPLGEGRFTFIPEDGGPILQGTASDSYIGLYNDNFIYCMTAITSKNLYGGMLDKENGVLIDAIFKFTQEEKKAIRAHFPNADSVVFFHNTPEFLRDFDNKMQQKRIGLSKNMVSYQHLKPLTIENIKRFHHNPMSFVFTKDLYFECEQEFRVMLDKKASNIQEKYIIQIGDQQHYSHKVSIDEFFDTELKGEHQTHSSILVVTTKRPPST
ncbi:MAG: hypothetical protein ACOX6Y_07825 [Christensenellales bacterium]|jgi:hypothetical protein